ncbi:MAG: hypothetical protein EBY22_12515 [Gammaproteobacteria bacterium]|nr:hypothetical protein [Gammaproteobacteria bacterium]
MKGGAPPTCNFHHQLPLYILLFQLHKTLANENFKESSDFELTLQYYDFLLKIKDKFAELKEEEKENACAIGLGMRDLFFINNVVSNDIKIKSLPSELNDLPTKMTSLSGLLTTDFCGALNEEYFKDDVSVREETLTNSVFVEFIERETRYFLTGFARNLMAEQKSHIEVVLEKNALRSVVLEVTQAYCIPLTVSRGYCSIGPRHDISQRYFRSGKDRLILLFLTDFDPDGQEIAKSFAQSMRNDFGIQNLVAHKVLLNHQDILENDLPSDMDAKVSSPHYLKFVSEFGTKVVELDAAPVSLIQNKLKEAIEAVINIETFNRQLELEEKDAVLIAAKRAAVLSFMAVPKK